VQVRHRIPVGVEPPVEPAIVAEQRDAEPLLGEQRHQRVHGAQRGAEQIQRQRRAGDVGDHDVVRQQARAEPRDLGEDAAEEEVARVSEAFSRVITGLALEGINVTMSFIKVMPEEK